MTWTVELAPAVQRAFRKELDRQVVRRMIAKLEEAASLEDPRVTAKPMTANLRGLWAYRIAGGYRIIADIQDHRLVILALEAGPRATVLVRGYARSGAGAADALICGGLRLGYQCQPRALSSNSRLTTSPGG